MPGLSYFGRGVPVKILCQTGVGAQGPFLELISVPAGVDAQGRGDRRTGAARRDRADKWGHFIGAVVAGRGVGHVGRATLLRHGMPIGAVTGALPGDRCSAKRAKRVAG